MKTPSKLITAMLAAASILSVSCMSETQSFGKPGYNPQRTSKDDTKPMNRDSSDTARITGTKPGSENQSR